MAERKSRRRRLLEWLGLAQRHKRELDRQELELREDLDRAKREGHTPHNRRAVRNSRKRVKRADRAVAGALAAMAKIRAAIARDAQDPGERAGKAALKWVGRTERENRAPWLDAWARRYVGEWMVGEPWCGLLCIVAWAHAGVALPKDTVSTVAILNRARRGDRFRLVRPEDARAGDLVVMDFSPAPPEAMHVGLALGPMAGGVIPTVEGNTSPSNGGSQNNGGGVYRRTRPRGVIRCVARPIR